MKNLLLIFYGLTLYGCSFDENGNPNDFNPYYLETVPYCFNQLELIGADTSAIYINPKDFEDKKIVDYLDSVFGNEYCDVITECYLPMDIPNKKLFSFPDMFPLKMELHKTCETHYCGFKNYMEVLINANHQILFEGEYLQIKEVVDKVPEYFAYSDTLLNVKPSKTIMTIQWDKEVNHDTLALLFMNVVDGYFVAVDNYSIQRFDSKVCELSKSKLDTLKKEFPFRLQFPSYMEIPIPVAQPLSIEYKEIKSILEDGTYSFDVEFAEWDGDSLGSTCSAIIKGDYITIINDGSLNGEKGEIIDEGTLLKHKSGKWIISHSKYDVNAEEIGGCSDGPIVIDLKNKKLVLC